MTNEPFIPKCNEFYAVCPCGEKYPRGIADDYQVECECGQSIIVPKAKRVSGK